MSRRASPREILRCKDRWGREIVLQEATWRQHILLEHAELVGNEAGVQLTLTDPTYVMHDRKYADRENFYRLAALPAPYQRTYLKVCVRFRPGRRGRPGRGYVVTAYATITIKRGEKRQWP